MYRLVNAFLDKLKIVVAIYEVPETTLAELDESE